MLKRICKKKILLSFILLLTLFSLYLTSTKKENKNIKEEIVYTNFNLNTKEVYLLDDNNYLSRIKVPINNTNSQDIIEEIISIISCNAIDKIPNNFKCAINKDTKINSINLKNGLLKIDLNNNFLNVDKALEEKAIESLVYSLTDISDINNIIIYIDGKLLTELPKSKVKLPSTLNRDFGINKKYELTSTKDISKTTIYYINDNNDNVYYTPITLINNDPRDKIEIIIDELSNKIITDNVSSYLNNDTQVLNHNEKDSIMTINFNDNVLNDFDNNSIIEEVLYTISLSVKDNYNIETIFFNVNDKEIAKTSIKSLE